MKKFLSLVLSVVMAVTAVIGAAPLVYASPDGTQIPVIHVVGTGTHIIRTNENGETSFNIDLKGAISLFPFDVSKVSIPSVTETYLTLFSGNHFSMYSPVSM